MTTTVTLQKTNLHKFMDKKFGGKFSEHKKSNIDIKSEGLFEACYDQELGNELMKIAKAHYWDESIGFICGVNHLLLRKAGMASKLQQLAGLESANMVDQMQQVYDRYVSTTAEKQVNLSMDTRQFVSDHWDSIKSTQAVGYLLNARSAIARMLIKDALSRDIRDEIISIRLSKTLQLRESPMEKEVMKRLDAMAPQLILHLGGKKLSHKQTMEQYAALHG